MELQMQLSLLFTALLFLVLLVVKGCGSTHQKHNARRLPLPPGPRKLPFIGDLHRLVGLPHHALRNLSRKYGPLMFLKLGEVPTVVVSSPKMARAVMKNQEYDLVFANRDSVLVAKYMKLYDGITFGRYGDCWRQLKKISIVELLSVKRVQSYWPLREEVVNQLVDELSSLAGTSVNLSAMIGTLTNDITSLSAFGKIYDENKKFIPLLEELLDMAGGFYIADLFPSLTFLPWATGIRKRLEKLRQNMDKILDKIIDDHRVRRMRNKANNVNNVEDLVDVLLRVQEDNELEFPLGNSHIKTVTMELFMAGSETSATTIIWAFAEMMKNPRVMEKAQGEVRRVFKGKMKLTKADIDECRYLKFVIKETLRLHPAAALVPRESRERAEIEGYEIPKKTKVIINAWALGRDPEYWEDAEMFMPERFQNSGLDYKGTDFEYIPFGAGRRICPGMTFGVATVELALAHLLYHFDWSLPGGITPETFDMTEVFCFTVGLKSDLHLIPSLYSPEI